MVLFRSVRKSRVSNDPCSGNVFRSAGSKYQVSTHVQIRDYVGSVPAGGVLTVERPAILPAGYDAVAVCVETLAAYKGAEESTREDNCAVKNVK